MAGWPSAPVWRASVFRDSTAVQSADVADEWGDPGDGAEQEIFACGRAVSRVKRPFRDFADGERVANLTFVKHGREFALRNAFRKNSRCGSEGAEQWNKAARCACRSDHAEGRVLASLEMEFAAGIEAEGPQIFREVLALDDTRA